MAINKKKYGLTKGEIRALKLPRGVQSGNKSGKQGEKGSGVVLTIE